jgi:hypothetical protein
VPGDTTANRIRREIADAYERGWDECLDTAREVVRGAADLDAATVRLDVLAASRYMAQTSLAAEMAADPGA